MNRHLIALRFGRIFLALLALLGAQDSFAKKKPPEHPVNLNTASAGELQLVPGIGPSTADKILAMRKSYGAFKGVDDLLAIKGIGPKRLDKMRKYLTVGKGVATKTPGSGRSAAAQGKAAPMKTPVAKPVAVQKPPAAPEASEEEEP